MSRVQRMKWNRRIAVPDPQWGALVVTFCLLFNANAQTANESPAIISRIEGAVELIRNGKVSAAEISLTSILAESPRNANALNLLGVVRAKQERPAEAERLFQRALNSSPTHIGAHINLAELFLATDRAQLALPVLLSAHKLAPDRSDINLKLAALYSGRREYTRALEYVQLIPPSSANAAYYRVLLTSLFELKRIEDARKIAPRLAELSVGDSEEHAKLGMLLADHGLVDEGLGVLEAARARSPQSFRVLYAIGVVNAAARRFAEAEANLTAALQAKPDDILTLRALGRVSRANGDLEKALAHLVQARRVAPASADVLYDFGVTALQMDLLLDALPAFEHLHRLRPREPAYLYALAATQLRKGEEAESARLMKSYVELRPRDAAGFYLLGLALHLLKDHEGAAGALQKSLKLKPDPDVEYLLGETLSERGNRAGAVEILERVVKSRPDHAGAQAALGTAYRALGNDSAARSALERAVELNIKDLRAYYQLGLIYAKLGDKEGAGRMFARSDELRGEQRNKETVILKLIPPPRN
jgi:tetratricopeptide (TPR) repeat protein